mmetsp:Transcript_87175/g.154371  ORF Transcript_87175/g.154371 Transcript_87175/m.154371 type:complete len:500 (-) Transcript_87175:46-1545(-)
MALQPSLARRSSAVLEEARQRLRQRFLQRWPAAQAVPSEALAVTAMPETQDCLQAARERLRIRYLAKWPVAVEVNAPRVLSKVYSQSPYLEEARQRIRTRAMARFGPKEELPELQVQDTATGQSRPLLPGHSSASPLLLGQKPIMPLLLGTMRRPSMLRAVSTRVSSSSPLSPRLSFLRPRTVSLIGAPIADGQPLGGVDLAPDAIRQAGLQRVVERQNFNFQDSGNVGMMTGSLSTDQETQLVKNSSVIGRKVGELHKSAKAAAADRNFVLTIGGDHSIASGSITGVHAHNPNMSVIWVDAHGDCNTPESSESKNYHGMPLAHVLGWFETSLPGFEWCDQHLNECGPLPESRVALVGIRDLDAKERAFVKQSGLHVFTMSDIDCFGIGQVMEMALACVDNQGTRPLHLSFDIDACDPDVAPGTGTRARGGLSYREAHYICERMSETQRLISMDLVEVNPSLDDAMSQRLHGDDPDIKGSRTVSLGVELVASALGKCIL